MSDRQFLLVKAAFKRPVPRTPVWIMRQAGRYLAEYREVRKQAGGFLDLCTNPELAARVSLQPLELIGVDAVIMFSDILTPLIGMGMDLAFTPGPVFSNPVKTESDIDGLLCEKPDRATPYVGKILDILKREVGGRVPIIGFAGAPFTLATYMVEGGGSKLFPSVKALFWEKPEAAFRLMQKLTEMTVDYLNYQIDHGADVVQLFDTWAGIFSSQEYRQHISPHVQNIFSRLKRNGRVPKVYYVNGGGHLLREMAETGTDVIGLDWTVDIGEAKRLVGDRVALQGNLDPAVLFCSQSTLQSRVASILNGFGSDSGHIFNLGHGIDRDTDPEKARFMVETVKRLSQRSG